MMPTYKVTDPNTGQTVKLTGDSPPSGAELEQIFSGLGSQQQIEQPQPALQEATQEKGLASDIMTHTSPLAYGQTALTMGSAMAAEPIAGLYGAVRAPFVGAEQATQDIADVKRAMTYEPTQDEYGQASRQQMQAIGGALEPVGKAIEWTGEQLGDIGSKYSPPALAGRAMTTITGDPVYREEGAAFGGAVGKTVPEAIMMLFGAKGIQKMRKGTQLIDDAGTPTKALRQELDKVGLSYDDLTPQAKQAIPKVVEPKLIPGADVPKAASQKALLEQIKAGGRSDALAPLKVVGEKVVADVAGKEAVKQGFRGGVVQSIKTSSLASKMKMKKMVSMMRAIKKNERLALDFRPSDIVGDAVTKRITFIRDKASKARTMLDDIAKTKLKGKKINTKNIGDALNRQLDDLDIKMERVEGKQTLNFNGSMISKDATSQRVIKDLVDLLSEGGVPDALRAHKLKRQLDVMIDFNKKSAAGLTDVGKKVLKEIRHELNQSVRVVDKDYAKVNDILSSSLDSLGAMDKSVGSIDIFGKGADAALGTRMRALLSNQQGRIKIQNALDSVDDTVKSLGGKFDDNIKDLAQFSDILDERFGAVAKTGFQDQISQAMTQAARQGAGRTAFEAGVEVAGKSVEKMRGINEFNAFEALNALLK